MPKIYFIERGHGKAKERYAPVRTNTGSRENGDG